MQRASFSFDPVKLILFAVTVYLALTNHLVAAIICCAVMAEVKFSLTWKRR